MAGMHSRRIGRRVAIGLVAALCALTAQALPATARVAQAASSGVPNHFDPTSRATSAGPAPAAPAAQSVQRAPRPRRTPQVAARPAAVALDPSKPAHVTSGDGALELDVPAGAVSALAIALQELLARKVWVVPDTPPWRAQPSEAL